MGEQQRVESAPDAFALPPDELRSAIERLLLAGLREQAHAEEARRLAAAIERRVLHDPLTDLPNRALFLDRLEQQLRVAARERTTFAVLFLDLDHFKTINDRHGHAAGDLVLREVAARLRGELRAADTVARLHGDEFAVLLPDDGAAAAAAVVRKLRRAIAVPVALPGASVRLGASIGCAVYPAHGADAATLIARADAAMYAAKRGQHDRVGGVADAALVTMPTGVVCQVCGRHDPAALIAYPGGGGTPVALCSRCARFGEHVAALARVLVGNTAPPATTAAD